MSKAIVNTFKKLDTDTSQNKQDPSSFYDAQDLRLISDEPLSNGALVNYKGTKAVVNIGVGNKLVGYSEVGSYLVMLIYNPISTVSSIIRTVLNQDNSLSTIDILYSDTNLTTNTLGFKDCDNIETIGRFENEYSQKIYFAVPNQPLRAFNIANTLLESYPPVSTLDILPNNSGTIITFQDIIQGGNIESGKIQYACKLFNKYGSETTFSTCSELVSLTSSNYNGSNEFKGSDLEVSSGKSVKINITLPDLSFNYIRIYSIHYKVKDTPIISLVGEMQVLSTSFSFIDNGTILDQITLEEFNIFGGNLISAETIGTKNNILFAANTKEISDTISLDCRAYRFNSDSDSRIYTNDNVLHPSYWLISSDGDLIQKYVWVSSSYSMVEELTFSNYSIPLDFDCINRYNNEFEKTSGTSIHPFLYDRKSDGITYGGTGKIVSYEIKVGEPVKLMDNGETIVNSDNIKFILKETSFKQGETYRFGLVPYDLKGKPYFTEWIGDIRIPYFNGDNNILESTYIASTKNLSSYAKNISIEFSINTGNIEPTTLSKISGFQIVKVQRTLNDKSVVAQGCSIGGTVFHLDVAHNRCIPSYYGAPVLDEETITGSIDYIHTFYSPEFNINGGLDISGNFRLNIVKILGVPLIRLKDESIYYNVWSDFSGLPSIIFNPINKVNSMSTEITDVLPNGYSFNLSEIKKTIVTDNNGGTILLNPNNYTEKYINRVESTSAMSQTMYGQTGVILTSNTSLPNTYIGKTDGFTYILDLYVDNASSRYGGNTYINRILNEYESVSKFILCPQYSAIIKASAYGDTYNTIWDTLTSGADPSIDDIDETGIPPNGGVDRKQVVSLLPLESSINCMLTGSKPSKYLYRYFSGANINSDNIGLAETELKGISIWGDKYPKIGDFNSYNTVYSSTSKYPTFFPKPFLFTESTSNPNLIQASEKKINGEHVDSWSKFLYANTLEVEGVYGEIHKLTTLDNKLYFFQEGAIGVAAVNDRYIIGQGDAAKLSLGTGQVLERYDYVKYNEGIIKPQHVINTITNLYFIDHNRKVLDIVGSSDIALSIEKGVNTLFRQLYKDKDTLVTIGFDPVFRELLFNINNGTHNKTLVYNENMNMFQPRSSATPQLFLSISDGLLSFKQSENIPGISNYIYQHNAGDIGELYSESLSIDTVEITDGGTSEEHILPEIIDGGLSSIAPSTTLDGGVALLSNTDIIKYYEPSSVSILVNTNSTGVFVSDNVEFRTEVRDYNSENSIFNDIAIFETDINDVTTGTHGDNLKTVTSIEFKNSYQSVNQITVVKQDNDNGPFTAQTYPNTSRRHRSWTTAVPMPKDKITKNSSRFVDTFLSMKFTFNNHDNKVFKLHDITTYIRPTHK